MPFLHTAQSNEFAAVQPSVFSTHCTKQRVRRSPARLLNTLHEATSSQKSSPMSPQHTARSNEFITSLKQCPQYIILRWPSTAEQRTLRETPIICNVPQYIEAKKDAQPIGSEIA